MLNKETIAAISTGMSNSGIGIVRISGDDAFQIIDRIYKGEKIIRGRQSYDPLRFYKRRRGNRR